MPIALPRNALDKRHMYRRFPARHDNSEFRLESIICALCNPAARPTLQTTSFWSPERISSPLTLFLPQTAFLSWLRLAVYMAIVSIAILISFHLHNQPSKLERRIALPFGLLFWCLAVACLVSGLNNYIKTVNRYSRRQALVQSGWGTQVVFTVVACAIVAACVLFLSINVEGGKRGREKAVLFGRLW